MSISDRSGTVRGVLDPRVRQTGLRSPLMAGYDVIYIRLKNVVFVYHFMCKALYVSNSPCPTVRPPLRLRLLKCTAFCNAVFVPAQCV